MVTGEVFNSRSKLAGYSTEITKEKINGDIRDREKVMRGLKITDTSILKGMQFTITSLNHMKYLTVRHPLRHMELS